MPNGIPLEKFESLKRIRARADTAARKFREAITDGKPETALASLQEFAQEVIRYRSRIAALQRQLIDAGAFADAALVLFKISQQETQQREDLRKLREDQGRTVVERARALLFERAMSEITLLVTAGAISLQSARDRINGALLKFGVAPTACREDQWRGTLVPQEPPQAPASGDRP